MSTGRPLAEQLRAEDRHVILEINAYPPLATRPRDQSRVAWLVQNNDVIVVARIVGKQPQFVVRGTFENKPAPFSAANWISSVVQARVEQVIKTTTNMPLEAGGILVFEEDGGRATLGNINVEAVIPWIRTMEVGRRYLIGGRVENGRFVKGLTYEDGSTGLLKSLMVPVPARRENGQVFEQPPADEFEQWTMDQAVFEFGQELAKSAPR
jgi:hypothetical protein